MYKSCETLGLLLFPYVILLFYVVFIVFPTINYSLLLPNSRPNTHFNFCLKMNSLLFNKEVMGKYYNCSGRTLEEWEALGHPSTVLALIYGITGLIYFIFLLPFLAIFIKSNLTQHSCFKIMFFIAIIDMIEIPLSTLYGAYAAYIGMVYCMSPMLNYVSGCVLFSCWISASCSAMILGINRSLSIINKKLSVNLFGGRKTLIWLSFPACYFVYCILFHPPPVFNSSKYAFFFNPFFNDPGINVDVDYVII